MHSFVIFACVSNKKLLLIFVKNTFGFSMWPDFVIMFDFLRCPGGIDCLFNRRCWKKHVWRSSGIIKMPVRWRPCFLSNFPKGNYIGWQIYTRKVWKKFQKYQDTDNEINVRIVVWALISDHDLDIWCALCSRNKQTDLIINYEWVQITIHFFQTKHSRPCIIRHLQIMYNSYLLSAIINHP